MDRQIKKRCNHQATIFRCIERDSYGDKTFDDGTIYACFRAEKVMQVRTLAGELTISNLQLYFDTVLKISGDDELLFEERTYPIQAYSRFDGLKKGTGTTVIYL